MSVAETLALMREMADGGRLDRSLVYMLIDGFPELNSRREAAMASTAEGYRDFSRD
ncbi:MAG: hypothetical protein SWK76_05325 [Actinomycetota bacterium]|nr:hypothetical protein [Actinomycetota bacterium]